MLYNIWGLNFVQKSDPNKLSGFGEMQMRVIKMPGKGLHSPPTHLRLIESI